MAGYDDHIILREDGRAKVAPTGGLLRILVRFQMNNEAEVCAVIGVEGEVTDFILPSVGDIVSHRDVDGKPCVGRVTERMFTYAMPNGIEVDGTVIVTLLLDRSQVH